MPASQTASVSQFTVPKPHTSSHTRPVDRVLEKSTREDPHAVSLVTSHSRVIHTSFRYDLTRATRPETRPEVRPFHTNYEPDIAQTTTCEPGTLTSWVTLPHRSRHSGIVPSPGPLLGSPTYRAASASQQQQQAGGFTFASAACAGGGIQALGPDPLRPSHLDEAALAWGVTGNHALCRTPTGAGGQAGRMMSPMTSSVDAGGGGGGGGGGERSRAGPDEEGPDLGPHGGGGGAVSEGAPSLVLHVEEEVLYAQMAAHA